jgi:hypothetical protein
MLSIIIDNVFELNAPFMFLYMMTLGEAFGGLTIFYYQLSNWKQDKEVKYFDLKIIHNQKFYAKTPDTNSKKILLLKICEIIKIISNLIIKIKSQ